MPGQSDDFRLDLLQTFKEEAVELLSELETALIGLADDSENLEFIGLAFRALHTIKGAAEVAGASSVQQFTHRAENLFAMLRDRRLPVSDEVLQLALAARDQIRELVETAGTDTPGATDEEKRILAEIEHLMRSSQPAPAQSGLRPPGVSSRTEPTLSTIRVKADRLDGLIDLVGELLVLQSQLRGAAGASENQEMIAIAEQAERLIERLRETATSMRMVTIGTVFSRFKRFVHEYSRKSGKRFDLTTSGGDTELDRGVIDQLYQPMVHLIRNSIDHGLEFPQVRAAAGKPSRGKVHLSASRSGDHILVEVCDDGRGLDLDGIRLKAMETGLLTADHEATKQELENLIFTPGFTTASEVTDQSGRGVGMEVVKQTVDALRGSVEISSKPGRGTSVVLNVPLSLAITHGLIVMLAESRFLIPLETIAECLEDGPLASRGLVAYRGSVVPRIRLGELFRLPVDESDMQRLVIVRAGGTMCALVVDQIVGEFSGVVKVLSRPYHDIEGISGVAVLGDGTVALLIDTDGVMMMARREGRIAGESQDSGPSPPAHFTAGR